MTARDQRTPYDHNPGISELEEAVLGLLEEAGIDTETNDAIAKLIHDAQQRQYEREHPEMDDAGLDDLLPPPG